MEDKTQLTIYIPEDLKEKIVAKAEEESRSINNMIYVLLQDALKIR